MIRGVVDICHNLIHHLGELHMPVQQESAPVLHGNALQHDLQRQQLSHLLSDMHLRLDECWFTGADTGRLQTDIERIEREHAALFCPCHLCAKPTVFPRRIKRAFRTTSSRNSTS